MLKIEFIWRELLYQAIEKNNPQFTITDLSSKFKLSTSSVSHALLPLRELGIVRIGKKQSSLIDTERLLYFWATRRNLKKEIIYQTYNSLPAMEKEALMPTNVFPTAYSALRLYFNEIPADYENIYFYAQDKKKIEERFFPQKKPANIFILQQDNYLSQYQKVPLAQIFVDLWNLPEWYAKDFLEETLKIIKGKIGL